MRPLTALGFALAPLVLSAGCRVVATVLSSVDSGLQEGGSASAGPDGADVSNHASTALDAGSPPEPDTGAARDAELDAASDIPDAGERDSSIAGDVDAEAGPVAAGDAAGDDSACATFEPASVWTPTSVSFQISSGQSGAQCGGEYQFSEVSRTLSGVCFTYYPGGWLVHLSSAQVDSIVASVSSVQTACQRMWCYRSFTSLAVYEADAHATGIPYSVCSGYGSAGIPTSDPGGPIANFSQSGALVGVLFDLIAAACEPDASVRDPAVCEPIDQDGDVLDAAAGD